jgi:hypothetical protein
MHRYSSHAAVPPTYPTAPPPSPWTAERAVRLHEQPGRFPGLVASGPRPCRRTTAGPGAPQGPRGPYTKIRPWSSRPPSPLPPPRSRYCVDMDTDETPLPSPTTTPPPTAPSTPSRPPVLGVDGKPGGADLRSLLARIDSMQQQLQLLHGVATGLVAHHPQPPTPPPSPPRWLMSPPPQRTRSPTPFLNRPWTPPLQAWLNDVAATRHAGDSVRSLSSGSSSAVSVDVLADSDLPPPYTLN